MGVPLVLVSESAEIPVVARKLARAGFVIRQGFAIPAGPWDLAANRLVMCGVVADRNDVAAAVVAAARGAGIVAACTDRTLALALRADLGRIGTVSGAGVQTVDADNLPLDDQQRVLLERLAAGESINAAATAEFISLRTANRRLSQARSALNVRTTREAVMAYLKGRDGG